MTNLVDPLKDDEVWIALDYAKAYLIREGAKAIPSGVNSMQNQCLWLIENAMRVYKHRANTKVTSV